METPSFVEVVADYKDDSFDALNGYRDPSIPREFFADSLKNYEDFLNRREVTS